MGLLDDAIREHLDLKRRRGADPAEVARLEQEALGPVRRERAVAETAETADGPQEQPASAASGPETPPTDAERADGDEDAPPPAAGPSARQAAEPEPEVEPPHDDPRHSDIVHQPTTEFRVEDHDEHEHKHDDHDRGEDVLEETPDFLQETPEHDRLWFEQRPPRDFDFDG
jgi:hypothetical protein